MLCIKYATPSLLFTLFVPQVNAQKGNSDTEHNNRFESGKSCTAWS